MVPAATEEAISHPNTGRSEELPGQKSEETRRGRKSNGLSYTRNTEAEGAESFKAGRKGQAERLQEAGGKAQWLEIRTAVEEDPSSVPRQLTASWKPSFRKSNSFRSPWAHVCICAHPSTDTHVHTYTQTHTCAHYQSIIKRWEGMKSKWSYLFLKGRGQGVALPLKPRDQGRILSFQKQ